MGKTTSTVGVASPDWGRSAVATWRNLHRHRSAQAEGRDGVFSNYRIRVASILRDNALETIELAAWQAIGVPREWDDPEREPDESPDDPLDRMFGRVRNALHVWSEVLDDLVPGVPGRRG